MDRLHESEHEARSPGRICAWHAATLGFLAGVAVAIPVLLSNGTDPTPTTEAAYSGLVQPSVTDAREAQTNTTVAQTVDPQGPVVEQTELDTTETSIGTLRWTRVSGDTDSVPGGPITASPDGRYVSEERSRTWWSEDGFTWTHEPSISFGDVQDIRIFGDWAIGWTGPNSHFDNLLSSKVFERVDGNWVEVNLPTPNLPEIDGIDWWTGLATPVEWGDATVVLLSAHGQILWGDHYGRFDVPCGGGEVCEMGPFSGGYDEHEGVWDVVHPSGGSAMARVEMIVDGRSIEFVDTDTRERVHTIETPDATTAQAVAAQLIDYSLRASGVFVRDGRAPFVFHDVPFAVDIGNLFAAPDGGFVAFEVEHGEFGVMAARVWTSADGSSWGDRGTPSFFGDDVEWITIGHYEDRLVAQVVVDSGFASGEETFETFESTNGIDWLATERSTFPLFTEFHETEFGAVATAMPQSQHLFWISLDGETWEEVAGPPGPHQPNGGGMSAAGAAGDILWAFVADDSGSRTLWIGTFDG